MKAPIPPEALEDGERVLWTGRCAQPLAWSDIIEGLLLIVLFLAYCVGGVIVIRAGLQSDQPSYDAFYAVAVGIGILLISAFSFGKIANKIVGNVHRLRRTTYVVTDRAALMVVGGPGGGVTRYPIDAGIRIDLGLGSRPFLHMATVKTVEEGSPVHTRAGFEGVADPMGAYAQLLAVREACVAQRSGHDAQQGSCTVAGGRLPGQ